MIKYMSECSPLSGMKFPKRAITMPPARTTGLQPAAIGIDVSLVRVRVRIRVRVRVRVHT